MPDTHPDWLKVIAFDVRDLIRKHGKERWHAMLKQYIIDRNALSSDNRPSLPLHRMALPDGDAERTPLTLAEQYSALAAVHDGACPTAAPIHPWQDGAGKRMQDLFDECGSDFAAARAAFLGNVPGDYGALVAFVSEARFCRSGSYSVENLRLNLTAVLEDVRADLVKAQPASDSNGGGKGSGKTDQKPTGKGEAKTYGVTDDGKIHAELARLERDTPPLSRSSGEWLRNKTAAVMEGIATRTLADYRQDGTATDDGRLGCDKDGRVWRREGTPRSHPWYLRSTLVAVRTERQSSQQDP